jgi:hypothetical protein
MNGQPIQSRQQLMDHIFRLIDDFDGTGNLWENQDLYTFLQAMAAWLNDCEGYYRNTGHSVDVDQASWQLFLMHCRQLVFTSEGLRAL